MHFTISDFLNSKYCYIENGITRLKPEYSLKTIFFNNELISHLIFKEWEEDLKIITKSAEKLEFYSVHCHWESFTKIVVQE